MLLATWITTIATVIAAAAAAFAWREARKATTSARRAEAIEHGRRHDEMTPQFDLECEPRGGDSNNVILRVILKEGGVDRLDEATITILDDDQADHWARGLPQGVSREEADAFVWGGWEFDTAASAQVVSNRTSRPRPYSLADGKNWDHLSLTRTRPARWMTGTGPDQWQSQYDDKPIRLSITCCLEGHEP
jgi:hypothetical protein